MFVDLVGFTPLSEVRDPEEVRELLTRYFELARTVVDRYGGVVEKFIGDAVMAVWGAPTAGEGDAERAVRAALELVEAVGELGQGLPVPGLTARAGVVTGEVAVTVGAVGQGMVAGDAVNTAARVQSVAEPGSVLVEAGTRAACARAISFTEAGARPLKGKSEPVPLWRATRVLSGVGGNQRVDGLEAPLVGRGGEIRLVRDLFNACATRRVARLVSVTGPAGVGKSRLGWEFEKYIDGLAATVLWHRGRCLAYGDGVAFWALAEMVRQRLGIAEEDALEVAAGKLHNGLQRWVPDVAERDYIAPRLGRLLGTTSGDLRMGQEELFAGWRLFFERLAAAGPVVLLVEDLHHADDGLLDFLEHLLDWSRGEPLFVLTFARPELVDRRPGFGADRRNGTTLALDVLDDEEMAALLESLVPGMPPAALAAICDQAQGIPLYAVETVRMLIDRDVVQPVDGVYRLVGDIGALSVPATLQSLLAARLDALAPDARRLVADAAVLGGTFPAQALAAVTSVPAGSVPVLLADLVRREVLAVRTDPLSPERGQYAFVQTLLRQVAYDTLSRRERKARHLAVAEHLAEAFASDGTELSEVIARHLLDALGAVPEDPDVPALRLRVVEVLTRAAERAQRTGAPATANENYSLAANLAEQVARAVEPDERAEHELSAAALRERAGAAAAVAGLADRAIEEYHAAAQAYQRHGRARDVARTEVGTGGALILQGRMTEARTVLLRAVDALRTQADADTVAAVGELARVETLAGLPEADATTLAALELAQALDAPAGTLAALLATRGSRHATAERPAQAVACLREAARLAEAADDTAELSRSLLNLADVLAPYEPDAAAEAARRAAALARRIGDRDVVATALANLLHALLLTTDWDQADLIVSEQFDADQLGGDVTFASAAVLLHTLRGRTGSVLEPLLAPARDWADAEDPQGRALARMSLAAASFACGDDEAALEHGHYSLDLAARLGVRFEGVRWGWSFGAGAALRLGRLDEADRLIGWLDEHPVGHVPPVLRAERRRVGAALLSRRRDAGADVAFEAAVSALRAVGSPYHLGVGLVDQAEHVAAGGDAALAQRLAGEALDLARALGARPLAERADALVGAGKGPVEVDGRLHRGAHR